MDGKTVFVAARTGLIAIEVTNRGDFKREIDLNQAQRTA
jgi:hypothetical protein